MKNLCLRLGVIVVLIGSMFHIYAMHEEETTQILSKLGKLIVLKQGQIKFADVQHKAKKIKTLDSLVLLKSNLEFEQTELTESENVNIELKSGILCMNQNIFEICEKIKKFSDIPDNKRDLFQSILSPTDDLNFANNSGLAGDSNFANNFNFEIISTLPNSSHALDSKNSNSASLFNDSNTSFASSKNEDLILIANYYSSMVLCLKRSKEKNKFYEEELNRLAILKLELREIEADAFVNKFLTALKKMKINCNELDYEDVIGILSKIYKYSNHCVHDTVNYISNNKNKLTNDNVFEALEQIPKKIIAEIVKNVVIQQAKVALVALKKAKAKVNQTDECAPLIGKLL